HLLALALGLAIWWLWARAPASRGRWIPAMLAACWLWVSIFLSLRYATINWAAVYFAWAFRLEAVLLIAMALRGRLRFERAAGWDRRIGLAIFLLALLGEPALGPLLGRSWRQAEVFGMAPDPTAVATLGVLLLARVRWRWALMIVPLLWC